MMRVVNVIVFVFSLLSVGQAAPVTNCELLIQPIEFQKEQLLGKWIHIAESTDIADSRQLTKKLVDSAWHKITAANESDTILVLQTQKMFGQCFSLTSKMTVKNSTLILTQPIQASSVLLNTSCPDCFIFNSKYIIGSKTYSGIQLLSRRPKVSAAELQEFKKQVECLSLPAPAVLDSDRGFCPDDPTSQDTQTLDLTEFMNNMGSELWEMFDSIMNSDNGLSSFFKKISNEIDGLKQKK